MHTKGFDTNHLMVEHKTELVSPTRMQKMSFACTKVAQGLISKSFIGEIRAWNII